MDRNIQRNGLVNLVSLLAVSLAAAAVARQVHSPTGYVALAFYGIGLLVAMVSYFQMRLEAREALEKLEFDELNKAKGSATLFSAADSESFPAKRSREQFERFLVPAFTVILMLLQAGAAYALLKWLPGAPLFVTDKGPIGMAMYAMFFIPLFLLGKYSANLARLQNQRLVRPGASYMLMSAFISVAVIASLAAAWFEFPKVDFLLSRLLCGVLILIALETLVGLVLEIYRPRVKGQTARLLYESRLVGLLGHPGGLITTAAQALDYQFGFKVSDTWFYRFMERALVWLVLGQLGLLWLSTAVLIVEPQEKALLERFGRPADSRAVLEPGIRFKLPWPFEKAYRYDTEVVQSINVGFVEGKATMDAEGNPIPDDNVLLWTRPHYKEEFNLLVATRSPVQSVGTNSNSANTAVPADLLTVSIPVHFVIRDLTAWAYNHASPSNLLEKLATREVVRYLVSVDIEEIMSAGRLKAAHDLKASIQKRANDAGLGIEVIFVGLQDIHPPTAVATAYEGVIAALQWKERVILEARGDEGARVPAAEGRAYEAVERAEGARTRIIADATATAGRFTNQITAFRSAPSVYANRTYLETVAAAVRPARKYVLITTNTTRVMHLNLEDKVALTDISDVKLPDLKADGTEKK